MDGYRNIVPITLSMARHIAYRIGFDKIQLLAESKGNRLSEISDEKRSVYELDIEHYRQCALYGEEMEVSLSGAKRLPEVMLIGLVSVYDAMLFQLLKVVFSLHEDIVLTSEKTLKFSDLSSYGTIEAAKSALIDKEIESILRESHHEQFSLLEKKLNMKLSANIPALPTFIEVCERRNLITHTGGRVSPQYIASGKNNEFDISDVTIGKKLDVQPKYYASAVNAVYEIGAKLCHVLWRKYAKQEREIADDALNELGLSLIRGRNYRLAEAMLRFGIEMPKLYNDEIKRMMAVNLANSLRLQERRDEAKLVLDNFDWSAVSDPFKICIAAVREDVAEVARLMKLHGEKGPLTAADYRDWPVFRGMRAKPEFIESFESVFGTRLFVKSESLVETPAEPARAQLSQATA